MTLSTEERSTGLVTLEGGKRRPAPELVIELFFGPLASVLAVALSSLRIPTAAVVLANGAAGIVAAVMLERGALVVAAALLQLKTLLDNADGRLARVSGRVTLTGRYLDTEVDLLVNVVLFAALGSLTGQPLLALVAFCVLTLLSSTGFNLAELYRAARGVYSPAPPSSGGRVERALESLYQVLFAWQDRLLRGFATTRLERVLRDVHDPRYRRAAELAYNDRLTMVVLANLGLSTQLAALGVCLAAGVPEVYLWLVVASGGVLPVLQLRRERLARRALSALRGG